MEYEDIINDNNVEKDNNNNNIENNVIEEEYQLKLKIIVLV